MQPMCEYENIMYMFLNMWNVNYVLYRGVDNYLGQGQIVITVFVQ